MPVSKQCPNGHMFEPDYPDSDDCPICADMQRKPFQPTRTTPIYDDEGKMPDPRPMGTQGTARAAAPDVSASKKTHSIYADLAERVVGWLVAVEGPLKGEDFRIYSGRNSLGRDPGSRIRIAGDQTVSGQQGFINFDPRKRRFTVSPGEGSNILYLNGDEVLAPMALSNYDTLEAGRTKLRFVPFCGELFNWDEDPA